LLCSLALAPTADAVSYSSPTAMMFYLAEGTDGSRWIAAEGSMENDSGARLLDFLARIPDRNVRRLALDLPQTNNVAPALVLGRIFRQREIEVVVGRTIPAACADLAPGDPACLRAKQQGVPVRSTLLTQDQYCFTECLWAVLGARRRVIDASTIVSASGFHIRDHPDIRPQDNERHQAFVRRLRAYVLEMGFPPEMADYLAVYNRPHSAVPRTTLINWGVVRE
jgi:hypothetical protein